MADVGFADLVEIYRHTRFDGNGGGTLTVATSGIAATLRSIEADQSLYDLTQVSLVEPGEPVVGSQIAINVAAPNLKLGILADTFVKLFLAPGAAFAEPVSYFVIDCRYASGDAPVPPLLLAYRAMLTVTALLKEAASYVIELQRELVFIGTGSVVVPITFTEADLTPSLIGAAGRLETLFADPLHSQEKAELLAAAVIELAGGQRTDRRFQFIVSNLERVCDEVEKGYRLFVSSFSYSKIRKEIETARLDYINKIHKTIVDIQGQLLGIPVATIVVASQLKLSKDCGIEFWTNCAVLLGAWIFVGLLWLAVRNQWHTLSMLAGEITGQRARLDNDYAALSDDFVDVFNDLDARIKWHRKVLVGVSGLALAGALLATIAFLILTESGSARCLVGG
ncbi:hypothetical protein MTR62_17210 [Novosphingobium sp. 1949]|uniref:Phage-related membrane protein n=1 Tax=Novosphingobium organovorum TaxID=2930092 RepID=A0ABT0BH55_9SPHN|nr:hypothetical protein [Novosphingobium organovorum]MCJ2184416.1 hypothetical protein [Novosphingobium organovorum]